MVGIVVSRLVGLYYRPAIVIAFDENGVGHEAACAGVPGVSLVELIQAAAICCSAAASMTWRRGSRSSGPNTEAFRRRFRECVLGMVEPEVLHRG
ncbi:MAG: hypothetical protein R3F11_08410 [Verrucomicrobiales bacterium]